MYEDNISSTSLFKLQADHKKDSRDCIVILTILSGVELQIGSKFSLQPVVELKKTCRNEAYIWSLLLYAYCLVAKLCIIATRAEKYITSHAGFSLPYDFVIIGPNTAKL